MARIVIEGVTKVFSGGVVAVNNVTIEVADGEFLVLVGPSGCGKTTLLRIVAGLEEVTDGEVAIGDTLVTDMPPRDRDVAMVFQNYALYPHMTVAENLVDRPAAAAPAQGPRCVTASSTSPTSSASTRCSSAGRRNSRAASASGSRWAGRWCASRRRT